MQIVWPKLPSFNWESKVNNYLTHVLGHEGPNSLLSELAKEGFASALLSSSSNKLYNRDGEIKIDITLTKKGVVHFRWVISLVFAFINKLRKEGPQQYIFNELKSISELMFDF